MLMNPPAGCVASLRTGGLLFIYFRNGYIRNLCQCPDIPQIYFRQHLAQKLAERLEVFQPDPKVFYTCNSLGWVNTT